MTIQKNNELDKASKEQRRHIASITEANKKEMDVGWFNFLHAYLGEILGNSVSNQGLIVCMWFNSILWNILLSTDDIPQQWYCYSTITMHWWYAPTVLIILHSTAGFHPQHWFYPSTVLVVFTHFWTLSNALLVCPNSRYWIPSTTLSTTPSTTECSCKICRPFIKNLGFL